MSKYLRIGIPAILVVGAAALFCFPGSPTVYYGDEVGMEGFEDPFNRRTFPWGKEDRELTDWFAALGNLRKKSPALRRGGLCWREGTGAVLAFERVCGDERVLCACNAGQNDAQIALPAGTWEVLVGDGKLREETLLLPARSAAVLRYQN